MDELGPFELPDYLYSKFLLWVKRCGTGYKRFVGKKLE
jgi:hypothetical protein